MRATLTPAQRKGKTYHSKRVFCATGFKSIHSSDGETQALVRWSSVDSLRIYARMDLTYQARRRDALLTARVHALNATSAPQVDETPTFEELDDAGELADGLDPAAA